MIDKNDILILCKVVDNFGDIGVVYRLARALSDLRPSLNLTLVVSNLESFHALAPQIEPKKSLQDFRYKNSVWKIVDWNLGIGNEELGMRNEEGAVDTCEEIQNFSLLTPHFSLILECFQCGRPDWLENLLFSPDFTDEVQILQIDYLTAEDYAEEFHLLKSGTRKTNIKKRFFMPGFTEKTGGLIFSEKLAVSNEKFENSRMDAGKSKERKFCLPLGEQNFLVGLKNTRKYFSILFFAYEDDCSAVVQAISDFQEKMRETDAGFSVCVYLASGKSSVPFENAWKKGGAATGGSTMFLNIGQEVKVEDLIRGIIIQSGNDACIVVAENIAGTEEEFVAMMNEKAVQIGLENSNFANSTGLPHPEHKMSVEDLAKLADKIINKFPEFYHIFSQKEFTYNGIKQGNRNPLLYSMKGADGLKTGHTEEAGFSLTASAKRGDRRLISVMTGMKSNQERAEESNNLMAYGFSEFNNYTLVKSDEVLAEIPVWYGKQKTVSAGVQKDLIKTMQRIKSKSAKIKVSYDKPLVAPIKTGQTVGEIVVEYDGNENSYPLVAKDDVAKVGVLGRFAANIKYYILGDK